MPDDDFDARLRRIQAERQPPASAATPSVDTPGQGMGVAFRIGTELVAALGIGVGTGLLLDHWLGTTPWLLIAFIFIGGAAGMLNVYRLVNSMTVAVTPSDGANAAGEGKDDTT